MGHPIDLDRDISVALAKAGLSTPLRQAQGSVEMTTHGKGKKGGSLTFGTLVRPFTINLLHASRGCGPDGKLKAMKFGKLLGVVFVAVCCGAAARAQLGIYGMYVGNQLTGIQCYAPAGTTCSSPNGKIDPSGGFGGVFYDFKTFGPVRLGGDVRAGVLRANKSAVTSAGGAGITTTNNVLGGVRAAVKVPMVWLKPYVEGMVGYARSSASEPGLGNSNLTPRTYDNFIQYQFMAGTDVRIFPLLDLRPIELGIGQMNRVGTGAGTSSIPVKSIGAGLVLHLP